jgi:hypothetical protein
MLIGDTLWSIMDSFVNYWWPIYRVLGSQDAKEGLNLEIYAQVINRFMSGLLQVFTYMDSQL